jgi:hypothetical protein
VSPGLALAFQHQKKGSKVQEKYGTLFEMAPCSKDILTSIDIEDVNTADQNPDANNPLPISKTSENVEISDHNPISDHASDNKEPKPKKPLAGTPYKLNLF